MQSFVLPQDFDKSDSVSFRLVLAASIRTTRRFRSSLTLSCSARGHVRALNWRGRECGLRVCVRPLSASSVPHACVASKQPHIQKERVRTRRRLPIWRASTQHGVCMRVYALPLVRGVYVHPHTWRHACGSLCVGTQTKGGKPVSSGAPERREQPFYSIPGGKRVARSSRRQRRTTSTPSTTTATSCTASWRDTAMRGRRWR